MKLSICMLVVLVAVVSAMPRTKRETALSRIDRRLSSFLMGKDKKGANNVARDVPKCDGKPCCETKTCPHGRCSDSDGDNFVYLFGWQCVSKQGSDECGTKDGQFSGIDCDVDAETACDKCLATKGNHCIPTQSTISGKYCYNKSWDLINARELDIMYGEGTSKEATRIAREENGQHDTTQELRNLLRQLIAMQ